MTLPYRIILHNVNYKQPTDGSHNNNGKLYFPQSDLLNYQNLSYYFTVFQKVDLDQ